MDKRETFKLSGVKLLEIIGSPADGRTMAVLLAVRGGSHARGIRPLGWQQGRAARYAHITAQLRGRQRDMKQPSAADEHEMHG